MDKTLSVLFAIVSAGLTVAALFAINWKGIKITCVF